MYAGLPVSPVDLGDAPEESVESLNPLAISFDGKMLISAGMENIYLWSLPDGVLQQTIEDKTHRISLITSKPANNLIASGSFDNTIKLYSLPDGSLLKTLQEDSAILSIAISNDGKLMASGSQFSGIKLWSLPDGLLLNSFRNFSLFFLDFS